MGLKKDKTLKNGIEVKDAFGETSRVELSKDFINAQYFWHKDKQSKTDNLEPIDRGRVHIDANDIANTPALAAALNTLLDEIENFAMTRVEFDGAAKDGE